MNFLKSLLPFSQDSNHKLFIQGTIDKGEQESTVDSPGFTQLTFYDEKNDSPSPDQRKNYFFIEYKVEKHDTLYSIALAYHNSPETLKEDNKLESDALQQGQIIRIRAKLKPESARVKAHIKNKDESLAPPPYEMIESIKEYKLKTLKQLRTKAERIPHDHWRVFYCTNFGDPQGTLTVDSNGLVFTPLAPATVISSHESLEESVDLEKRNQLLEVVIDIRDIAECNMMAVPSLLCEEHFNANHEFEKDYVIQVLLYTHGERSLGKYLDELFHEMQEKKIPYACLYFKLVNLTESMQEYTNDQKHHMLQEVQAKVMAAKHSKEQSQNKQKITKIPHFEFLFDRFEKKDADLLRKVSKNSLWNDVDLIHALGNIRKASTSSLDEEAKTGAPRKSRRVLQPRILNESNILTLGQFTELLSCVPELYQTLEWQLIYSNLVHGTSFSNLLRRAEHATPFLLVIKDEHDFVFGAYGSEKLWYSQEYYGTGETFLFTFRDLEEVTAFHWNKKSNNQMFMMVSDQGLTFGAKPHFGLWVNNELTDGRSFPCETFSNPRLSYQPDFHVLKIEVWTIKEPLIY